MRTLTDAVSVAALLTSLLLLVITAVDSVGWGEHFTSGHSSAEIQPLARGENGADELSVRISYRWDELDWGCEDFGSVLLDVFPANSSSFEIVDVDTLDFITDGSGLPVLPVYYWSFGWPNLLAEGAAASFSSCLDRVNHRFPFDAERNQLEYYWEFVAGDKYKVRSFVIVTFETGEHDCVEVSLQGVNQIPLRPAVIPDTLCIPMLYAFNSEYSKEVFSTLTVEDIDSNDELLGGHRGYMSSLRSMMEKGKI